MKAIILVGGEGTRLRPLTSTTPKQMLPVVEVPMIERVVGRLVSHGITDVVLSLGYRPDAFTSAYPDGRCAGARLSYVIEAELLDTAGAIRYAATESGVSSTFLVLNGDVLTDLDVSALIEFHRSAGGEGTISLTPVVDPSSFGVVPCDAKGKVEAFIEKPAPGTAPTNLINAGTYVLEPSVIERIPGDRRVNIERETFPAMVADGALYALAHHGYWLDVGTPERFLQACADLLSLDEPPVPGARREGSDGVWRADFAAPAGTVVGPSLIGDGATLDASASVARAVVGAACRVGAGAVVEDAVLMPGAVVGAGAVVRSSIVGPGARIGERASVTAGSVVGAGAAVADGAALTGARHA